MTSFFWLPHDHSRHVLPGNFRLASCCPVPSDRRTLCGLMIVVTKWDFGKSEWLWPTCRDCYRIARGDEWWQDPNTVTLTVPW